MKHLMSHMRFIINKTSSRRFRKGQVVLVDTHLQGNWANLIPLDDMGRHMNKIVTMSNVQIRLFAAGNQFVALSGKINGKIATIEFIC
jgi:hypothetical protein